MKTIPKLLAAAIVALASQATYAQTFNGGMPAGWSGVGSYGTSGANGVVGLAPSAGTAYGWVSTSGGTFGASPFGFGAETNGSYLRSTAFTAGLGDVLAFQFNYVTSDGAGFADYAWARVLNAGDSSQAAVLFTARTIVSGTTVPGFGMPPTDAVVPSAPIIPGGPLWGPLGGDSGSCFSGGCGYTGWISSSYTFTASGSYKLEFGAVNWTDTAYDTGLAFDGFTVADVPILVPEPESYAMMLAGLALMGFIARRRKQRAA